jgi:hypothetical protein
VVEHRLERVASVGGAAVDPLEPTLHGGQYRAEQLRDLGRGEEDEAFSLFFEA